MRTESKATTNHSDWILLSRMSLSCVLGLHDWERQDVQTLVVEVGMALDLDEAAHGDLSASVDYAEVLNQLEFIASEGRWRLLESLVTAMARHLLARPAPGEARAQVEGVRVKATKPDIFAGRAVPSVELARDRAWLGRPRFVRSEHEGVTIECLTETPDVGTYHVSLEPGAEWPLRGDSTAQPIAGAVSLDHHRLSRGERCRAPGILRADQDHARLIVVGRRVGPGDARHV